LKLNRNTHLVFDSDHFLAFILIFGVKIVPGFAFFEYFLRSFVVSGTFPIGSPNASWSRSLPDREPVCYSAYSRYHSRVLQCLIPIGNPIHIGNPIPIGNPSAIGNPIPIGNPSAIGSPIPIRLGNPVIHDNFSFPTL
jgi:hypothetical protein